MTLEWMTRIAAAGDPGGTVLFEGQTRLAFLREALDSVGLTNAHVILLDCDDATRARRLTLARKQPDLVNQKMMNWAGFLRWCRLQLNCRPKMGSAPSESTI